MADCDVYIYVNSWLLPLGLLLLGRVLAADICYLEPASVCTLGNEISIWYEVCIYFYNLLSAAQFT